MTTPTPVEGIDRPCEERGMTRGRAVRLAAGLLALAALALLLSQAGRLPGPAGEAVRRNAETGRDAAALFYTEVDGWQSWTAGAPARRDNKLARHALNNAAARSSASRAPTSTAVSPAR